VIPRKKELFKGGYSVRKEGEGNELYQDIKSFVFKRREWTMHSQWLGDHRKNLKTQESMGSDGKNLIKGMGVLKGNKRLR